jgi:large subunit ribosomal protein L21
MYAILQQSGHQYRVSPGDRLVVDRLTAEVGSVVALEPVVLVQNDDGTQVGTPVVEGARVAVVVVGHPKGAKIRVFKYKAKKHYRRTHGHRSLLTEVRVEALLGKGDPLPKAPEPKPAEAKAEAAKPARSRSRAKAEPEVEAAAVETAEAAAPEAPAAPKTTRAKAAKVEAPEAPEAETAATPDAEAAAEETPKRAPRSRARKAPDADETPAADGGETPEA